MKVVRPCSRMIAHTGFITVARLISRNKAKSEEIKDMKKSEEIKIKGDEVNNEVESEEI
ncbi:hypothetical protein MSIBF_A3890006 [groundwater metagenome]